MKYKKNRAMYNMYAADEMGEGRKPKPFKEWMKPEAPKKDKKLSDVITE